MKILHVSPTYFAEGSFIGGAERYTRELARAQAGKADVTLLSFGARADSFREGLLRVEILRRSRLPGLGRLATNPLSARFVRWVRWADVVHCHQAFTLSTDVALLAARLIGRRTFVTDLGGGHRRALSHVLPLLRSADALLLISDYSRRMWQERPPADRPDRLAVVYGGVDVERFSPGDDVRTDETLFVGRLLPHKGINDLIEAMPQDAPLRVVGRPYDLAFFSRLRHLAENRRVVFETDADDRQLVARYRSALVTVLPSVYDAVDGSRTRQPELLGLTVLESMACGTPVIVTDVASLPELVEDGVTGFVVPPNDPEAVRRRIVQLRANPRLAADMGRRGRDTVRARFTWPVVAARCLEAYAGAPAEAPAAEVPACRT